MHLALDPGWRRPSMESRMAADPGREGVDDRRHDGDLRGGELQVGYAYDLNRILLVNAPPSPTGRRTSPAEPHNNGVSGAPSIAGGAYRTARFVIR